MLDTEKSLKFLMDNVANLGADLESLESLHEKKTRLTRSKKLGMLLFATIGVGCLVAVASIWMNWSGKGSSQQVVEPHREMRLERVVLLAQRSDVRGDGAKAMLKPVSDEESEVRYWIPSKKTLENYFVLSLAEVPELDSGAYWFLVAVREGDEIQFTHSETRSVDELTDSELMNVQVNPSRELESEVLFVIVDRQFSLPDTLDVESSNGASSAIQELLSEQNVADAMLGRLIFVPVRPNGAWKSTPRFFGGQFFRLFPDVGECFSLASSLVGDSVRVVALNQEDADLEVGGDDVVQLDVNDPHVMPANYGESYRLFFSTDIQESTKLVVDFDMDDGLKSTLKLEWKDGRLEFGQDEAGRAIMRALRLPETISKDKNLSLTIDYRMHYGLATVVIEVSQAEYQRRLTTRLFGEDSFVRPTQLKVSSSKAIELNNLELSGKSVQGGLSRNDQRLTEIERVRIESESLRQNDDLKAAIRSCKDGLRRTEELFGKDSVESTWFLNELALLAREQGRNQDALELYQRTLRISDRILGSDHPESAITRSNYALLLSKLGYFAEAKANFERAILDYRLSCPPLDPALYGLKNNYVDVLIALGDWANAFRFYDAILDARLRATRPDPSAIATAHNNLGFMYSLTQFSDKAMEHYEESLQICQKLFENEPLHEKMIRARQNLASTMVHLRKSKQAIPLLLQVRDDWRKRAKKNNVEFDASELKVSKVLAFAYICEHDFQRALDCIRQAREISRFLYSDNHPEVGSISYLEGLCLIYQGKRTEGRKKLKYAIEVYQEMFALTYSFLSFQQRQQQLQEYRLVLDYYLSSFDPNEDSVEETYEVVSSWNSIIRQRRIAELDVHDKPELRKLIVDLRTVVSSLSQLVFAKEVNEEKRKELMWKRAELERQLHSAGVTRPLSSEAPRERLADHDVFLEFFEYLKFSPVDPDERVAHLFVFVSRKGKPTEAISLGSAESVRQAVDRWVTCIQESGDDEIHRAGQKVKRLIWDPVSPFVEPDAQLLISRAGPVSKLPFSALSCENVYLLQRNPIRFVYSTSDLVSTKVVTRLESGNSALLLGGLNYTAKDRIRSSQNEVDAIAEVLEREGIVDVKTLAGSTSRHEFQQELSSNQYTLLHCACHGSAFSLVDEMVGNSLALGELDECAVLSPLDFVFLRFPGRESASRITGTQISKFDLRNVALTVLSACDTGSGDETYGDVAMSLANSFRMAGVDGVVSNLWQAQDNASAAMMRKFYEFYMESELTPSESLRNAQLWMLSRNDLKHPAFWAGWEYNGR